MEEDNGDLSDLARLGKHTIIKSRHIHFHSLMR
jgi:hypothetical protein